MQYARQAVLVNWAAIWTHGAVWGPLLCGFTIRSRSSCISVHKPNLLTLSPRHGFISSWISCTSLSIWACSSSTRSMYSLAASLPLTVPEGHILVTRHRCSITTETILPLPRWGSCSTQSNSNLQLSSAPLGPWPEAFSIYCWVMKTRTTLESLIAWAIAWLMYPLILSSSSHVRMPAALSFRLICFTRSWLSRPSSSLPQSWVRNTSWPIIEFAAACEPAPPAVAGCARGAAAARSSHSASSV
mmetsp:Transcript_1013/g.3187  ORF Transcript_1013/g.3187 Transcript_1013/m.3187 type:complete len:244 (-) Transcript_1013:190-921(-)